MLSPPKHSPDGECKALSVTGITYSDGTPALISHWEPTAEELMLIALGAPIRIATLGKTQAPMKIGVAGDGEMEDIK